MKRKKKEEKITEAERKKVNKKGENEKRVCVVFVYMGNEQRE